MPKREEYFGSASELKPDELPNIRDVICFAKYVRDNNRGKSISVTDPEIGMNSYFGLRQEVKKCKSLFICLSVCPVNSVLELTIDNSLRSVSELSLLTLSDRPRWSLKYFVLFN